MSTEPTSAGAKVAAPPRHGPLQPGELAEVAVLGDLALVLEVIAWFAPTFITGIFQALAILPFAVLASRHRLRAGLIASIGAATVAGLVGGIGVVIQTALAGVIGVAIGTVHRRRWTSLAAVGLTLVFAGVPAAVLTLVIDLASPGFRKLSFDQIRIVWRAVAHVLRLAGLDKAAATGSRTLDWLISHWWLTLPIGEAVAIAVIALVCLRFREILVVLARSSIEPYTGELAERASDKVPVSPVPIRAEEVTYRYPGADRDALAGVTVDVGAGELVAVTGENGSGKSTLVSVISGRFAPDRGRVRRLGRPGYGEPGGTAVVFQRPESQVLGVRVRDDVWWGVPPDKRQSPAVYLDQVGLSGLEDRETSTLSGGELQRLAVASALARSPRLIISDEATAMLDGEGRTEVLALLRRLADDSMGVVHVTHIREETAGADRVVELEAGRVVGAGGSSSMASGASSVVPGASRTTFVPRYAPADAPGRPRRERPLLATLRGVGHVYAAGTPWAHRALSAVDLDLYSGEGVVVTGANGSGKTTLAWILGGLLHPSEGEARMGSSMLDEVPARVAVAFQHARLQLIRPTVLADVSLGLAPETAEHQARQALLDVGFDPDEIGLRRIDDLSGGEQRRVALAGLIARRPELLVLDEPLAGLDDPSRQLVVAVLAGLRAASMITTVVVSHDLDHLEGLGDRVLVLTDGRISSEERLGG